jgi:hypothetical protein
MLNIYENSWSTEVEPKLHALQSDTSILQISLHGLHSCQVWSSSAFPLITRLITLRTGASAGVC